MEKDLAKWRNFPRTLYVLTGEDLNIPSKKIKFDISKWKISGGLKRKWNRLGPENR